MSPAPHPDFDDTEMPPWELKAKLAKLHEAVVDFLGVGYDLDAINATLAVAAGERIDGDPAWLLVVSGSGNAKTETVTSLVNAAHTIITSTIQSEGALLSASGKQDRETSSNGGLLRRIGPRGILVIKDFTSILSMDRNMRGHVLAALREVYDGYWERNVGTGGGRVLTWRGRVITIGATTTAWDAAHAVIAQMGDRFVLVRLNSDDDQSRREAGRQSVRMTGHERDKRAAIADAAAAILDGDLDDPAILDDDEIGRLLDAADIVTRLRTAVETDYRGDAVDAHALEMPTRFGKQLAQIVRGATAIGMDIDEGMRLALRCAADSAPPLRLTVLDDVRRHPHASVSDVVGRTGKPRSTVKRTLEQLQLLGALRLAGADEYDAGDLNTRWTLRTGINDAVVAQMVGARLRPGNRDRECE